MRLSAPTRQLRDAGFTLVEVMTVLVVVALMSGVVMMTLPEGKPLVQQEAERFVAKARFAEEESIVSGHPVRILLRPSGFDFEILRSDGWVPLREKGLFRKVDLAGDVRLRIRHQRNSALSDGRVAYLYLLPTGRRSPLELTFHDGERDVTITSNGPDGLGLLSEDGARR